VTRTARASPAGLERSTAANGVRAGTRAGPLAAAPARTLLGAFLELLLIIANIGTAVVIVPIMRRQFEELSIGYVTARLFECTS
jgi:Domain of unknown function (DUF4386)